VFDARGSAWTLRVPRVVLVVAVVLGVCAMHVLAAVVGQHHTGVHGARVSMTAMDHTPPDTALETSTTSALGTAHITARATDHEHHHSMADCVLFLSAGIAVLVLLIAWAAARALRPSYRLVDPWLERATTSTPWRGPPPWHWPRISLCVIRV
jgi:hypothetical protein